MFFLSGTLRNRWIFTNGSVNVYTRSTLSNIAVSCGVVTLTIYIDLGVRLTNDSGAGHNRQRQQYIRLE